jgi:hypothetical protein
MDINEFIETLDLSHNTKNSYKSACKTSGVTMETKINQIENIIRNIDNFKANKVLSVMKYRYPNSKLIKELLEDNRKKERLNPTAKPLPDFMERKNMLKIIKTFRNEYQFLFNLLINHPVLRSQDYHRIKKSDVIRGTLIIHDPVKVQSIPIKIKLNVKEKKLLQNCDETVFDISFALFTKQTNELSRKIGVNGISAFRKYYSWLHPDQIESARNVIARATAQNHSVQSFLSYYS